MNATPFQSTSRGVVGFVSPMTDGFFDSTFGGTFPRAQKTTGFDAIALHGSADDLSYVSITADGATVEPAADLAGLDTYETCERVREQEGVGYDTHVIAAGPAGENRSALRLPVARVETARRRRRSGRQRGGSRLEERESRRRPGGRLRARTRCARSTPDARYRADETADGGTEMLQDYGTSGLVTRSTRRESSASATIKPSRRPGRTRRRSAANGSTKSSSPRTPRAPTARSPAGNTSRSSRRGSPRRRFRSSRACSGPRRCRRCTTSSA